MSSVKKATISTAVKSLDRSFTTQFCIHCTLGSMDDWREDDTEHDFASSTAAASSAVRAMPDAIFWMEDVASVAPVGREFTSAISSNSLMSLESEP